MGRWFYWLAKNERRCKTYCAHLYEMLEHQIDLQREIIDFINHCQS
jgi:hypothetical protein